jgi:hypothetical protein
LSGRRQIKIIQANSTGINTVDSLRFAKEIRNNLVFSTETNDSLLMQTQEIQKYL